jgi:hypothetical protein
MIWIMYTKTISKNEKILRSYPLYKSVRIRESNLEKIKARAARFNQTIDDLISDILMRIDYYERLGYELPSKDQGSF